MQNWITIATFAVCFLLKATSVFGAEAAPNTSEAAQGKMIQQLIEQPAVPATVAPNSTPVQNNITVNSPQTIAYKPYSEEADAATVLGAKASSQNQESKFAIIPMLGGGDFVTSWAKNTSSPYSFGLALDFKASNNLAFELEGGMSKYTTSYSYQSPWGVSKHTHDFNQYLVGLNTKVYLVRSVVSPYLGAGIAGVYYENMDRGPYYPGRRYDQWLGNGQLLAGADVEVAQQFAVGIRGSYLHPLFNRPQTKDDGMHSYPYYEDAGLMNTGYYRILGTMTVRF